MLNSDTIRGFMNKNFVVIRAMSFKYDGETIGPKYGVTVGPSIAIINSEDQQVDLMRGSFRTPAELEKKLNESLSGETIFMYRKKLEVEPDNVLYLYKLAKKLYDISVFEPGDAPVYIEKLLQKSDEMRKLNVNEENIYHGEFEINMLEQVEYMDAMLLYRKDREDDASKFFPFIEKYPESKQLRPAYFYATYGKGVEKGVHAALFKRAIEKYPAVDSFKKRYMDFALENTEYLEDALKVAEAMRIDSYGSSGYMFQPYAKLLAEKEDVEKLNDIYGSRYFRGISGSYMWDMVYFIEFWMDRDDAPVDVVEEARKLLKFKENSKTRQTYTLALLAKDRTAEVSEVYGENYLTEKWDDDGALYGVAYFWKERGDDLDLALKAGQRMLELKPDMTQAWFLLGDIHRKRGELAEALEFIEKCLVEWPDDKELLKIKSEIIAELAKNKK